MRRPIRSGHRGAAGLVAPNTLASYERGIALGCDLIEVDVQPTADGILVLLHDDVIEVAGERVRVDALSLAALREVGQARGVAIPTLDEALDLLRGRAVPLLDLKGVGFERELGEAVRRAGIARAIVCGRPLASLLATHAANPAIATSLTFDERQLDALTAADVAAIPTDAVTVEYRRLSAEVLGWLHAAGLTVIAWTVDDPALMRTLLDLGVDGITTNRPDVLAGVVGG